MSAYIPPILAPSFAAPARDVCPHCKTPVNVHRFPAAGVVLATYHCPRCGDVVPMRSAVFNPHYALETVA